MQLCDEIIFEIYFGKNFKNQVSKKAFRNFLLEFIETRIYHDFCWKFPKCGVRNKAKDICKKSSESFAKNKCEFL